MKFLKILKHCLHPAVIIGILAAVVLAYVFAPQLAQYSWILIALICPLSMVLMMATMGREHRDDGSKRDAAASDAEKI